MNFCSACGHKVNHTIPEGDNRLRYVCSSCETIHYQNPTVVAGCLPIWDGQSHSPKVLLCRRAIEPRKGFWTLPAGFMEKGETVKEGALRETQEEAHAKAEITALYTVFSLPHISQVYMFFRAELLDLDFSAGVESLEVKLFNEDEIPWEELAFPVIKQTLTHYYADLQSAHFPVRYSDIVFPRRAD